MINLGLLSPLAPAVAGAIHAPIALYGGRPSTVALMQPQHQHDVAAPHSHDLASNPSPSTHGGAQGPQEGAATTPLVASYMNKHARSTPTSVRNVAAQVAADRDQEYDYKGTKGLSSNGGLYPQAETLPRGRVSSVNYTNQSLPNIPNLGERSERGGRAPREALGERAAHEAGEQAARRTTKQLAGAARAPADEDTRADWPALAEEDTPDVLLGRAFALIFAVENGCDFQSTWAAVQEAHTRAVGDDARLEDALAYALDWELTALQGARMRAADLLKRAMARGLMLELTCSQDSVLAAIDKVGRNAKRNGVQPVYGHALARVLSSRVRSSFFSSRTLSLQNMCDAVKRVRASATRQTLILVDSSQECIYKFTRLNTAAASPAADTLTRGSGVQTEDNRQLSVTVWAGSLLYHVGKLHTMGGGI